VSGLLAIVGPTASGKSAVAMALAAPLAAEIVSADALQVYRGLDIGTAKPTVADRRRVPHHLVDALEPWESYSAGEFARRAREAIEQIRSRSRAALLVGGSGLYLRALLAGIGPLPLTHGAIRDRLRERLAAGGLAPLRAELAARDPATAERLAPADSQRTLRALEVLEATGRPLSEWIAERPFGERRLAAAKFGLTLPRRVLYDRIEARIRQMIEAGWVDEVDRLLRMGRGSAFPAFQAIGYRQIARFLEGHGSLEEAVGETVLATRRYAKRQLTWFRRDDEIHWIAAERAEDAGAEILELLKRPQKGWVHG
jgi:tRNA dimethylallyltransferase